MNAVKWSVVATMAVIVLVGAALLAPLAMAQGPAPDGSPTFDIGQKFNSQAGRGPGAGNGTGQCDNFVDEDEDGVCDLAGTGRGQGTGSGYEDADGDGVCDNATTGGQQGTMRRGGQNRQSGQSRQMQHQPAIQPAN
jgi:hypothetical protein